MAGASPCPTTSSFAPYRSQQPYSCLSFTMQLLPFRKNLARLSCSVVNALTTARCRYRLLRIADNRKGCPYGSIFFKFVIKPKGLCRGYIFRAVHGFRQRKRQDFYSTLQGFLRPLSSHCERWKQSAPFSSFCPFR